MPGLSPRRAAQLAPLLDSFFTQTRWHERIGYDPVEFPRRYAASPRDAEVSALLSASLAYGRADLFRPKLETLHRAMGESPAAFVRVLSPEGARDLLKDFVYRFNVGTDVAVLLLGMGRVLNQHGSLEAPFAAELQRTGDVRSALTSLTSEIRRVPMAPLRKALGPERGLAHLVPEQLGPGAAKRLNLFLRWVVRGPDQVDLGIWKQVPASALVIPLDTHVMRMAHNLRLTRRKDVSWRTAEEVTASLRLLDPEDPVRFDFPLCHYGMSGACPAKPAAPNCATCSLLQTCAVGPRVLRRK